MAQAIDNTRRFVPGQQESVSVSRPDYQAYQILHVAFVVAPIVAGLDKFFHLGLSLGALALARLSHQFDR